MALLYVYNLSPKTTEADIISHFSTYGELVNVDKKRNYAFVEFREEADAHKALALNNSQFMDETIHVYMSSKEARRKGEDGLAAQEQLRRAGLSSATSVVIYVEYGGFHLSDAAALRILELIGDENLADDNVGDLASFYTDHIPRHHPALIQTIQELGGTAQRDYERQGYDNESLRPFYIVPVQDEYTITEYDGMESVIQPQDMQWTKVSDGSSFPWQSGAHKRKSAMESEKETKRPCS